MYFDLTISKCQKQVIESISFFREKGGGAICLWNSIQATLKDLLQKNSVNTSAPINALLY